MFANCTHIIVSLLKAWKVTVVGIERDNAILQCYPNCSFKKIIFFSKFCKHCGREYVIKFPDCHIDLNSFVFVGQG